MSSSPYSAASAAVIAADAAATCLRVAKALRAGSTRPDPRSEMISASRTLERTADTLMMTFDVARDAYARAKAPGSDEDV